MVIPGLILRRNSIIMAGSVVTKSTEPYHTYSGIPAKDITDKLNGWKEISLNEKFNLLKNFVDEFINQYTEYKDRIFILENEVDLKLKYESLIKPIFKLIFFKKIEHIEKINNDFNTIFNLNTKQYIKKRSNLEINWMKFTVGFRARFIPVERFSK